MNDKSIRLTFTLVFVLLWGSLLHSVQPVAADPLSQLTCNTITPITMSLTDHGTGEKPQSKTWTYANQWWAVFPISSGTWLWRLDQSGTLAWTPVLKLSSNTSTWADTKVVGSVVHVLLYDATNTELVSVEYSGGGYQLWSQRPTASTISLSGSETATIDIDSTGRLWLATETSNSIIAYYNDAPYNTAGWNGPITVSPFNIVSDDIGVVTALPGNKIGVLWSNQGTDQFLFRVHNDGDPANTWQGVEEAAANNGIADDHVNVAVASDGTLYAAVKTTGAGQMKLLVRRPNGSWDPNYDVDTSQGTRPIAQLNEAAGILTVIYPTDSGAGGDMIYRETPTSSINFGSAQVLQSGSLNDPSSMKENYTDELVVVFFDRGDGTIHGEFCKAANSGPSADVGVTQTDAPDPVVVGNNLTYTLTVTNHGTETAVNTTLTDTLPNNVTFVSAVPDQGSCNQSSGTVICQLGNLNNGNTVDVVVVVTPTQTGTLTNSASVSSDTNDNNGNNNGSSAETIVSATPPPNADLGVEKTGTTGPIDVGQNINYTVTVTNHGPETAENVTIADTLPEGVAFVSAVPNNGSSCNESSGTIDCDLGNLTDQEVVQIAIAVTANATGTLTNSVSVSGHVGDSNGDNNSDTHDTLVEGTLTNLTVNPIDDAHVKSSSPTSNYGSLATIQIRETSEPRYHGYFKFEVAGLTGVVQSATLRLYVTDASNDGGSVYAVSNNYADNSGEWLESGLNWNNAPTLPATPLDAAGVTTAGQWVELDVTTAVSGNGTFSFGLSSNSSDSAIYSSSEGSNPPQLVVVSNIAASPAISINPTSLSGGQQPETQSTQSLTIGNTGSSTLNWSLFEDSTAAAARSALRAVTAVCATPADIPWATLSASSGSVAAADNATVDITFDSSGLADGSYSANVCVESNDPDTPTVTVPLSLAVCSPATAVSITNITTSGNEQTISWSGSATDSFTLWWGLDDPYFTPGSDCSGASNCAIIDKADSSYSHSVSSGSLYDYVLIALNGCGPNVVASANSNRMATFTFAIQPGN